MGKPTSDEQKKMEVSQWMRRLVNQLTMDLQALKRFQEQHPEMDFSKAQVSGIGNNSGGFPGI